MKLPEGSTSLILLQRTHYLAAHPLFAALTLLGSADFLYRLSVSLKAFLFGSRIKSEYAKDIEKEYAAIVPYLPGHAAAILDIGCGIAGIDALLSKHYGHRVGIFLLDRTLMQKRVYYGMQETGAFYNSLEISREVLEMNGVDRANIHVQEATSANEILFDATFDIVLSLLSWGFHYPVSTYATAVFATLKPGGMLIMDVRKETGAQEEIEALFGEATIISERARSRRIMVRKREV